MTAIKAGDLVYVVGPSHRLANGPPDLCVHSAVVKNVRREGSYSESASPELLASATYAIELHDNRPVLGFPKWTYRDYEVGISIHRSAADALRALAARAQHRRDEAKRNRDLAHREVEWAAEQVASLSEVPR